MKILNCVMTACFLFSAIVQYNDPDPFVWILIYGLAGLACVLAMMGRLNWIFPAAVGITALAWAMALASNVIGKVAIGELFEAFEMKDERVEVAREFGGLLIVVFWMAALVIQSLRRMKFEERVRKRRK
ncbi:MAG TPA: transmembrane 220 family protein [Blastocatellia bacterium]|nr:transmembrane 220 family protein [Blastocatellia bacterium]